MGGKHSVDVSSSRKRQRDVSVHSCEAGTLNVEEEGDKDPETPSLTKRYILLQYRYIISPPMFCPCI